MLPVNVPGLAFLGCEVSTFNNILTHGLQAAWLSKLLCGDVQLPPTGQMQKAVETEMNWKRTWMPAPSARAAIQQLHMPKYHDQLTADMGYSIFRKSNPLAEVLMPYGARDYSAIFGIPDRTAWMRLKALLLVLAVSLFPLILGSMGAWTAVAGACVGVYLLPEAPPITATTQHDRSTGAKQHRFRSPSKVARTMAGLRATVA